MITGAAMLAAGIVHHCLELLLAQCTYASSEDSEADGGLRDPVLIPSDAADGRA